ncbi:hypothetical protein COY27_06910 [Candidatus Woesearchaeota archaeon CG_4_10_14_0_2_um_filter_33_13]|nr:MAG: hypothetical protein COY27_06910 [Candidatus Woesearchaeota archaeon CG_4_10_14_0_2_um_filter_33_13]
MVFPWSTKKDSYLQVKADVQILDKYIRTVFINMGKIPSKGYDYSLLYHDPNKVKPAFEAIVDHLEKWKELFSALEFPTRGFNKSIFLRNIAAIISLCEVVVAKPDHFFPTSKDLKTAADNYLEYSKKLFLL